MFANLDGKFTFTTIVKGEIRTTTERPLYSVFYYYYISLKDDDGKQMQQLLDNGIFRPSRSPYNSPVWIEPKKIKVSRKKKYYLVIIYKKLNTVTISDRYTLPDISNVLYSAIYTFRKFFKSSTFRFSY